MALTLPGKNITDEGEGDNTAAKAQGKERNNIFAALVNPDGLYGGYAQSDIGKTAQNDDKKKKRKIIENILSAWNAAKRIAAIAKINKEVQQFVEEKYSTDLGNINTKLENGNEKEKETAKEEIRKIIEDTSIKIQEKYKNKDVPFTEEQSNELAMEIVSDAVPDLLYVQKILQETKLNEILAKQGIKTSTRTNVQNFLAVIGWPSKLSDKETPQDIRESWLSGLKTQTEINTKQLALLENNVGNLNAILPLFSTENSENGTDIRKNIKDAEDTIKKLKRQIDADQALSTFIHDNPSLSPVEIISKIVTDDPGLYKKIRASNPHYIRDIIETAKKEGADPDKINGLKQTLKSMARAADISKETIARIEEEGGRHQFLERHLDVSGHNSLTKFLRGDKSEILRMQRNPLKDNNGNLVHHNERGLYYMSTNESGELSRIYYKDPLEIAQLRAKAWDKDTPLHYANETLKSQDPENGMDETFRRALDEEKLCEQIEGKNGEGSPSTKSEFEKVSSDKKNTSIVNQPFNNAAQNVPNPNVSFYGLFPIPKQCNPIESSVPLNANSL